MKNYESSKIEIINFIAPYVAMDHQAENIYDFMAEDYYSNRVSRGKYLSEGRHYSIESSVSDNPSPALADLGEAVLIIMVYVAKELHASLNPNIEEVAKKIIFFNK